jgi:hypothetical protein
LASMLCGQSTKHEFCVECPLVIGIICGALWLGFHENNFVLFFLSL